jgi:hypothetical protein
LLARERRARGAIVGAGRLRGRLSGIESRRGDSRAVRDPQDRLLNEDRRRRALPGLQLRRQARLVGTGPPRYALPGVPSELAPQKRGSLRKLSCPLRQCGSVRHPPHTAGVREPRDHAPIDETSRRTVDQGSVRPSGRAPKRGRSLTIGPQLLDPSRCSQIGAVPPPANLLNTARLQQPSSILTMTGVTNGRSKRD